MVLHFERRVIIRAILNMLIFDWLSRRHLLSKPLYPSLPIQLSILLPLLIFILLLLYLHSLLKELAVLRLWIEYALIDNTPFVDVQRIIRLHGHVLNQFMKTVDKLRWTLALAYLQLVQRWLVREPIPQSLVTQFWQLLHHGSYQFIVVTTVLQQIVVQALIDQLFGYLLCVLWINSRMILQLHANIFLLLFRQHASVNRRRLHRIALFMRLTRI